jgi:hypothetical protein
MDSKLFFSKIREIIREEIDYAMNKKLKQKDVQTEALLHGLKLISQKEPKKSENKTKKVSNFNSINDILNETKRTLQESRDVERDLYFDSHDAANFGKTNQHAAIPNGITANDVPDEVMSALTRDYSALMKKIDEKKGR